MSIKLSDCNPKLRQRLESAMTGQAEIVSKKFLAEYAPPKLGFRLQQDVKPLCNKLEAAWGLFLSATLPKGTVIRPQAKTFRLANGVKYRPDWTAIVEGIEHAWECKGGKNMKGNRKGVMTVKVAAHEWPEVKWHFVTKDNGQWQVQLVLP